MNRGKYLSQELFLAVNHFPFCFVKENGSAVSEVPSPETGILPFRGFER
jgi:hypothetical protein